MKICLLSGAVKNSGDFLIVKRGEALLRQSYPHSEIFTLVRNNSLEKKLKEINSCDVVVFAGGPVYHSTLYPENIPLVSDLSKITPPMFFLGGGWFGSSPLPSDLYHFNFTHTSLQLLHRAETDGFLFGCRDWYSVKVLQNNGFINTIMTGCPAWYDLKYIQQNYLTKPSNSKIEKIVVSDPADVNMYGKQSVQLLKYLIQRYPTAKIYYVFHRGNNKDEYTTARLSRQSTSLQMEIKALGIECIDISYSCNGFSIYDNCDLHIGHRVHAHIYNLSIRNMSILLEEDARGAGVNEALGLWSIRAYEHKLPNKAKLPLRAFNKIIKIAKPSSYAIKQVSNYIDILKSDQGDVVFQNAFTSMQNYYGLMQKHIKTIGQKL